jgi:hypothetical protein
MKWFKHYSNASTSAKLNILMEKHGIEGYGKYWLLVELLADKWSGDEPRFEIHYSTIKQRLRTYHDKITRRFLKDLNESRLMSIECKDNLCTIYFPKLLEIKDNHTKNLQVSSPKLAPRKEKKREEKKRLDKKGIAPDTVVQLWNNFMSDTHGFCHGIGTGKHLENFVESRKFLITENQWISLFEEVRNIKQPDNEDFNWTPNLTWLCDYDNALKILNGNMATKKSSWLDSYEPPVLE